MSKNNEHMSSSAFKKYLSEKATSSDKAAFEGGIEEGSFEAEALEGFNSLENDAEAISAINAIEKEVAARTGLKKERKLAIPIWKTMGIAASLLLFVGLGYMMTNVLKTDGTVAKNETKNNDLPKEESNVGLPKDFETLETADSVEDGVEEVDLLDAEFDTEQEAEMPMPAPELDVSTLKEEALSPIRQNSLEKTTADKPAEVSEDFMAEEDEEIAELAPVTTTVSATDASSNYGDDVQLESEISEIAASKKKADNATVRAESKVVGSNSYFNIAKVNVDSKNYNSAIDYFQRSIDNKQHIQESNYYIGFCYYNLNKNVKANKYFDTVIKANSPWASNAKWYKALMYEEKGDTAAAKQLLEDLANGNSGFKNQAKDKLKAY